MIESDTFLLAAIMELSVSGNNRNDLIASHLHLLHVCLGKKQISFSFKRTLHNTVNANVPAPQSEKALAIKDVLAQVQMCIVGKPADVEQKTSHVRTR